MRMTPRLLAAATVVSVSVAQVSGPFRATLLVHGVLASVFFPVRPILSLTWSTPCESLPATAFTPTV